MSKKEEFLKILKDGFEDNNQNRFLLEIIDYLLNEYNVSSIEFNKFMLDLTDKYLEGK